MSNSFLMLNAMEFIISALHKHGKRMTNKHCEQSYYRGVLALSYGAENSGIISWHPKYIGG